MPTFKVNKIVCGLHGSHYNYKTGINPRYIPHNLQNLKHGLKMIRFMLILKKLQRGKKNTPKTLKRDQYQGLYADSQSAPEVEPHNKFILDLAKKWFN